MVTPATSVVHLASPYGIRSNNFDCSLVHVTLYIHYNIMNKQTSSLPSNEIHSSNFNSASLSRDSSPGLFSSVSLSLLSLSRRLSLFLRSWSRELPAPDSRFGEHRLGPVKRLTVIGDMAVQHLMLTLVYILQRKYKNML